MALFSLGYFKAQAELPMICRKRAEGARGETQNAAGFGGGQKDTDHSSCAKPRPGTAMISQRLPSAFSTK